MYLHSCQSTTRKRVTHGIYSEKVCVLCSIQRRQSLRSPPSQSWNRNFQIFFPSASSKPLVCYFSCGVYCSFHTLQSAPSPPSTSHSIPVHFLQPHFPIVIFLPIFQNTLMYLGFFPFYNHRVLPSLSLPTLGALPGQPGTGALGDPSTFQWKRWQCFGACSADRAWVWQCWNWLPIFTAGHFPFALEGLLQSWKLHLLGLYRLKNLKYFLWDRALTKGSIHQKYDAMDFHNPACRQTALDKCVFIIAAQLSSAFPTSFSLKIGKIKVTF